MSARRTSCHRLTPGQRDRSPRSGCWSARESGALSHSMRYRRRTRSKSAGSRARVALGLLSFLWAGCAGKESLAESCPADLCSMSSVSEDGSCVRSPVSCNLGPPLNPCLEPGCDPLVGCTYRSVPNGTTCNRETSGVCVDGVCASGDPCSHSCQKDCVSGVTLRPVWSHHPRDATQMHFFGSVSPDGRIQWSERRPMQPDRTGANSSP